MLSIAGHPREPHSEVHGLAHTPPSDRPRLCADPGRRLSIGSTRVTFLRLSSPLEAGSVYSKSGGSMEVASHRSGLLVHGAATCQLSASPPRLCNWVTVGKSLNFFEPQFLQL